MTRLKYTMIMGEKVLGTDQFKPLKVEVREEFYRDETSKEVAYDIMSDKLDYFIIKRKKEIQERKVNVERLRKEGMKKKLNKEQTIDEKEAEFSISEKYQ